MLRGTVACSVHFVVTEKTLLGWDGGLMADVWTSYHAQTPGTAVIDADGALGIHVGPHAMRIAVQKARACGVGTVSVFNHGHLGGAGYHAQIAADAGCIGHCFHAPGGGSML